MDAVIPEQLDGKKLITFGGNILALRLIAQNIYQELREETSWDGTSPLTDELTNIYEAKAREAFNDLASESENAWVHGHSETGVPVERTILTTIDGYFHALRLDKDAFEYQTDALKSAVEVLAKSWRDNH